jgi:hypothetical protein
VAETIFVQANLTDDPNSKNYTVDQFNKSWDKWIGFFVLFNEDAEAIAFSGIRDFGSYARIFDRYFVFKHVRKCGLGDNNFCQYMVNTLLLHCNGKIPFFSMEFQKRRNVLQHAVISCNNMLLPSQHFYLLDGMYETAPNSWQNIAIQTPHVSIELPRQDIK